jgi:methylmalonyl-CoA mutase, C-terminal domain
MAKNIKVLLAKLGLDVHSRGVFIVARQLRDAGMEVIYIGNSTPAQIIKAAIQEDADIIGVSSLGGAHLSLGADLMSLAAKEKISATKGFVIGGAIPPDDAKELLALGFDATFASGATKDEIVTSVREIAGKKVK